MKQLVFMPGKFQTLEYILTATFIFVSKTAFFLSSQVLQNCTSRYLWMFCYVCQLKFYPKTVHTDIFECFVMFVISPQARICSNSADLSWDQNLENMKPVNMISGYRWISFVVDLWEMFNKRKRKSHQVRKGKGGGGKLLRIDIWKKGHGVLRVIYEHT